MDTKSSFTLRQTLLQAASAQGWERSVQPAISLLGERVDIVYTPSPSVWGDLLLSLLTQSTETTGAVRKSGSNKNTEKGWGSQQPAWRGKIGEGAQPWDLTFEEKGEKWCSGEMSKCLKLSPGLSHAGSNKQSCCSRMQCQMKSWEQIENMGSVESKKKSDRFLHV